MSQLKCLDHWLTTLNASTKQKTVVRTPTCKNTKTIQNTQKMGGKKNNSARNTKTQVCYPETREWTLERLTDSPSNRLDITNVRLDIKTRTDAMTSVIPEMMYSSLKYQFIHTVNIKTKDTSELEMLCCNIKVINPTTGVEVLKNNQSMILGKTQGIIMNLVHGTKSSDEQTLTCKVKLQFGDCSYHYKMMHFAIRFVAVSAPFQVFARRSKRSTGKRKVDLVDEDDYDFESLPPVEKKAKNTHNNTITLEQYQNAFEEMLAFKQRMQMDEGRVALQFVMARLIQANMPCDNHLSGNYPFNGHIESYFSDLLTPASTMPSLLEPAASEVYSSGSMTSLLMSGVVDPFANLQVPEMYESPVESPTDSESSALSDESSDIDWDHILEENVKDCQPSSHELLRVEQSNYQVANLC